MPVNGKPPILLHLGCGHTRMDGWVNCDLFPTPETDVVFDVQREWPFADNSVKEIYASHMLEHLDNFFVFFAEAWRVLQPNGTMAIRTPYGAHRLAWTDPTHLRPWFAESFAFLQPGYGVSVRNPQETEWLATFGVAWIDLRVAWKWAPVMRWKWGRKLLVPFLENIENSVQELWAYLYALKTPDAIEHYKSIRVPYSVPARYAMYKHHLELRADLHEGEWPQLIAFDETNFRAIHGLDGAKGDK
jgi:SAM-dependent methyltransferase